MKQRFFFFITCLFATTAIFAQSLTEQQLALRSNLEQAAAITAEVVKNPAAKKVVIAGILSGVYVDESILFKDLMNPTTSTAYLQNAQLGETPSSAFATEFNIVMRSGRFPGSETIRVNPNLVNDLIQSKAQIYFAYSEDFVRDAASFTANPTVTFNPLTDAETNPGLLFNGKGGFSPVTVNEAYVMANPTFIINMYDGNFGVASTPANPTPAIVTPNSGGSGSVDCSQPPTRMSVTTEHFRFESQWDPLWNGGPEFYVCRGDVSYSSDGTQIVGSAGDQVLLEFKRRHKNEWRQVSTLWDTKWEFDLGNFEELEQHIIVYEDDGVTSTTVGMTGVSKVDAKLPKIGGVEQSRTATISHTRHSCDALVFNQQWDRCWFINTNTTDQGLGMFAGRAARGVGGSGAVKLTMRINPF